MKTGILLLTLLSIGLLILAGCTDSATGAVPRAPPALPSGGGCGIGAPADSTEQAQSIAQTAGSSTAL